MSAGVKLVLPPEYHDLLIEEAARRGTTWQQLLRAEVHRNTDYLAQIAQAMRTGTDTTDIIGSRLVDAAAALCQRLKVDKAIREFTGEHEA